MVSLDGRILSLPIYVENGDEVRWRDPMFRVKIIRARRPCVRRLTQ